MNTRQIMERRAALKTEMASIHAAAPTGELPADRQAAFDRLGDELRGLESALDRQTRIDAADRNAPAVPLDGGEAELRVGLSAAIRAQMGATDREAGRAREVSQELARRSGRGPQRNGTLWQPTERRTLTSGLQGTSGNGAGLVERVQRGDLFIDAVYANMVTRSLGAQTISDLHGITTIPRQTAPAAVGWVLEGQPIPLTDAGFDQLTLSMHTVAARVEYTHNLTVTSNPQIDALLEAGLSKSVGVELDRVALLGTGAGGQPAGIASVSTSISYPKAGVGYGDVIGALTALEAANFTPTGWAFGPGVRGALLATAQTGAQNLLMTFDGPLMGLPQASTTNLAANQIIVGDFSNLLIATWGPLEILANPYAAGSYEAGNVQVRALLSCDVAVRNPAAFRVLNRGS